MALRRFDIEAGGDAFAFKAETEPTIDFWLGKYPAARKQSAVIPLLWLAQKDNDGWLSEPAMREVADRLEMPYIRVYEVATFYTMFRLKPVGKHHIQLCGTTPCMLRGANDLKQVCESKIGKKFAVTDDGKLSWEEVECLGACANAPMVQINDDYFEDLTVDGLGEIIEKLRNGADVTAGPQVDRINSAPEGGTDVLTEAGLFDGSRNGAVTTLPNLPEPEPAPEPEPEAKALPEEPAPTNTAREETTEEEVVAVAGERPEAAEVAEAERDNLKEIKGVGPVNEGQLNELGIYTFAQIAAWTPANVDWVEDFLSFPGRIAREDWIGQAKVLAAGGETEFSKRVEAGEVDSSKDEGE
ncbi:MAG: NADH-quinone oxidoreductase subunit NuoE [Hyphomonadaceae bacterium]|nr:NADH-quinone oxidoreductase subunit NuoE [Hyphomonadaceae bacterium]